MSCHSSLGQNLVRVRGVAHDVRVGGLSRGGKLRLVSRGSGIKLAWRITSLGRCREQRRQIASGHRLVRNLQAEALLDLPSHVVQRGLRVRVVTCRPTGCHLPDVPDLLRFGTAPPRRVPRLSHDGHRAVTLGLEPSRNLRSLGIRLRLSLASPFHAVRGHQLGNLHGHGDGTPQALADRLVDL